MDEHMITIKWDGPFGVDDVIKKMNDGGSSPDKFAGNDYGVYQIYGNHILCGKNTLLYVGKAVFQTFSRRIKQHKNEWLSKEIGVDIYLGRLTDDPEYSPTDNWFKWIRDTEIVESILIYKYAPNYNSSSIATPPELCPYEKIRLLQMGNRNKLRKIDKAPEDYKS